MTHLSFNTVSSSLTTKNYAASVNEKFQTEQDEIVSLEERWKKNFIAKDATLEEYLPGLLQEFRDRFPQYTLFSDMYADMVQMTSNPKDRIKLRQLLINATIQRELDPDWIIHILGKFDPFFVNIVRVYPQGDKFCIWDGQHTTFTLICVAMFGFGLSWEETMELEIPTAL